MGKETRRFAAAVVLGLIVATGAMAGPDKVEKSGMNQELAMKNFEHSLRMDEFPGIVESTVYNVVMFKNRFPELDYNRLGRILQHVVKDNPDSSISYKAQLANMYLNYSSTIELTPDRAPGSHEYIFKQISEQLEQKFLAAHE